jgi:hypothetical protein
VQRLLDSGDLGQEPEAPKEVCWLPWRTRAEQHGIDLGWQVAWLQRAASRNPDAEGSRSPSLDQLQGVSRSTRLAVADS